MLQTLLAFQGSQGSHSTNKHQCTVTYQVTADNLSHTVILSYPETSLALCLLAHSQGILNRLLVLFHEDRHSLLTALYQATQKLFQVLHIFSYATEMSFICISRLIVHTL